MRPGQNNNNKRMRNNRPPNNRRGPNPLTRSYESNGPDVKIRGNAHHVAEKYLQLARDAHTGGDPVAAENYLQHAEHYFRLIAAAQAAQLAAQGRAPGEPEPEDEDDDDGGVLDRFASPAERAPPFNPQQQQPQPYAPPPQAPQPNQGGGYGYERQPYQGEQPQHNDRNNYQPRGDRPQQNRMDNRPPRPQYDNGQRDNRGPREFRPYRENNQQRDFNAPRDVNPPREFVPQREPQPVVDAPAGLPSFITAAPRVPTPAEILDAPQPIVETVAAVAQPPLETVQAPAAEPAADEAQAEGRNPRGRRRRLRSPYGGFQANADETPPTPGNGPTSD